MQRSESMANRSGVEGIFLTFRVGLDLAYH
jgi:hypothetical protein